MDGFDKTNQMAQELQKILFSEPRKEDIEKIREKNHSYEDLLWIATVLKHRYELAMDSFFNAFKRSIEDEETLSYLNTPSIDYQVLEKLLASSESQSAMAALKAINATKLKIARSGGKANKERALADDQLIIDAYLKHADLHKFSGDRAAELLIEKCPSITTAKNIGHRRVSKIIRTVGKTQHNLLTDTK